MESILSDLAIGLPIIKGQNYPVRNCWHFSTDGTTQDVLFRDREDFVAAMNRIYTIALKYGIVILAFCLMDNHLHFILYGSFDACNRFIHEYVRQTSIAIARRHGLSNELRRLPIHHQAITDDAYLKTAICYVIKNPVAAGLPWQVQDYPWSSGPLYFRGEQSWALPGWLEKKSTLAGMSAQSRAFHYFLSRTKEEDVESRGGAISRLSLPDTELRQHKREILQELFGKSSSRELDTTQRLRLARELRRRYNSSPKQIARMVGLQLEEIESFLK